MHDDEETERRNLAFAPYAIVLMLLAAAFVKALPYILKLIHDHITP